MLTGKHILTALVSFLLAFFLGTLFHTTPREQKQQTQNKELHPPGGTLPKSTPSKRAGFTFLQDQENDLLQLFILINRLRGRPSQATLEDLFDKIFSQTNPLAFRSGSVPYIIMQKWGETAPIQGLERLKTLSYGQLMVSSVFLGWANKDPEAAIAFYNEHYATSSHRNMSDAIDGLVQGYALHSPMKACDWLMSKKDALPEEVYENAQYIFLRNTALKHPELIPSLLEKTGTERLGNAAYNLGLCWDYESNPSPDWLQTLPEDSRLKAESGRIMAQSKGNLEKIKTALSALSEEEQIKVTQELAIPIFVEGAFDLPERLSWIMDSLPVSDLSQGDLKYHVKDWFSKDSTDAKTWIDSLPPGGKKELLLKWYSEKR